MYLEMWRAEHSTKAPVHRRRFTEEEDRKLRSLVETLGTGSWEEIAEFLPRRSGRQCRDRYKNYLLDSLVNNPWTPAEDAIIIETYNQIGPRWVEIAKVLSGRSGNSVKNRWYKRLCKRVNGVPAQPLTVVEGEESWARDGTRRMLDLSHVLGMSGNGTSPFFEQGGTDRVDLGWIEDSAPEPFF
jgi:hypothetical protein